MSKPLKIIIIAIITALLSCLSAIDRSPSLLPEPERRFAGDTIVCLMDIKSARYEAEDSGFNYALADMLEKDESCTVHIVNAKRSLNREDSSFLASNEGKYDIIITNSEMDSIAGGNGGLLLVARLSDESIWAAGTDDLHVFRAMSGWIARIKSDGSYEHLYDNFFGKGDAGKISPYDRIVKHFSKRLGWDWKLVSAIIYSESMFINGTSSRKGAIGLMQIKPSTGAAYGIYDLSSPVSNIDAGTRHLRYLERLLEREGIQDSTDLVRFTLAAYNAGEGRIEDCRALASALGKNPDEWENIVEVMPLMSQKEYYSMECVKRGRFNAKETLNYVEKVLSKYEEYRKPDTKAS